MKRLLLVRHGETSANTDHIWHGSTDTPLTEQGHRQRQLLGEHFASLYMDKPDLIIASPLQRAHLTAQAVANQHQLRVELNPNIKEYCLGDWEGYGFTQLQDELKIFDHFASNENFRSPNGETRKEVTERMLAAIHDAWQHPAKNVVFVSHGLAISFAVSHILTGTSSNWMQYAMDNTAVTEINLDKSELIKLNQTLHLNMDNSPLLDTALVDNFKSS